MSDTDQTYTPPTTCVVPPGADVLDDLTVRELDIVSRQLGCDVSQAVLDKGTGAGKRWSALPRLAWLWAKRTDPHAKLDPFLDLGAARINALLRNDDDQVSVQAGADDPTANPTDPAHAS